MSASRPLVGMAKARLSRRVFVHRGDRGPASTQVTRKVFRAPPSGGTLLALFVVDGQLSLVVDSGQPCRHPVRGHLYVADEFVEQERLGHAAPPRGRLGEVTGSVGRAMHYVAGSDTPPAVGLAEQLRR